ncbi:MAG: FKBP-type peptidyl-prolyl cis-trans isomerase [Phenylobacterium sp.]|jgi:FKBP-type peptidyl-prolyl cis-trans isomerase|uniref:FKBP-type peptidyl-prolyl cis-trans isomerase n=1 Tax=Phenylobacterium sp. TaxID=1871053 RepID=UPI001A2F1329|nr:FKBP-type peptidyl-prolyl cis-trans isomerase [Phenylobacterium sp.]MBJ7412580.1 FKBP-type peptidyl-prolyl cis-trans isomerase [Phenylobacterium sp.]
MRLIAAAASALFVAACATTAPPAKPVAYTGTPQEQWEQGQKAYEAWSKARPGWIVTPSGLQAHRVKAAKASAPRPVPTDTVTIHYVGRFIDGRVFDSSRARGEPATFPLPRLIQGWQEGVPMMRVGETWEFVIPGPIAYGGRHRDPIPANSTLLFEIELLGIGGE